MTSVTMRALLESGVHFGHKTRYANPKMKPYIFGKRNQIHIIDLEKTLPLFQSALDFIGKKAENNAKILFVGTKFAAQDIIEDQAKRCGMPFVCHRWLGGMLTNYKTVRKSIKRLKDLEALRDNGTLAKMIKKEALKLSRELDKLTLSLEGIKEMGSLPDVLFVIDVGQEKIAVKEALRLGIPIVGIVDTNNSPENIDFVVPGNDDSMRSIELYATTIADTILAAKQQALQVAPAPVSKKKYEEKKEAGEATQLADENSPKKEEAAEPVVVTVSEEIQSESDVQNRSDS